MNPSSILQHPSQAPEMIQGGFFNCTSLPGLRPGNWLLEAPWDPQSISTFLSLRGPLTFRHWNPLLLQLEWLYPCPRCAKES